MTSLSERSPLMATYVPSFGRVGLLVILAFVCFAFVGCAKRRVSVAMNGTQLANPALDECEKCRWYGLRVRIPETDFGSPRWYIDSMIAGEVAAPLLRQMSGELKLWRFHRRAAPDQTGHQFTWFIYTNSDVAQRMQASYNEDSTLAQLKSAGLIEDWYLDSEIGGGANDIGASSDPKWPVELRRAWPGFAMGSSATWLELIEASIAKQRFDRRTLAAVEAAYQRAEKETGEVWTNFGQHAFIHHLSAIMGYVPIAFEKKIRF